MSADPFNAVVTTQVDVRFAETDSMGVVHHAVFVDYLEVGRTDMMAAHGLDYAVLERDGLLLAVVEVNVRYASPARFGDRVIVETLVTSVENVRVRFDYRVLRDDPRETLLASGHTVLAALDRSLKPRRVPAEVAAVLHALAGNRGELSRG